MSLPTTIWWCEPHSTAGGEEECWRGATMPTPCHMIEAELHPLGSRVTHLNGPVFVERIDYEAAAKALHRVQPDADLVREVIDAALVGKREAKVEERCGGCQYGPEAHSRKTMSHYEPTRRFVTEWEEVEE